MIIELAQILKIPDLWPEDSARELVLDQEYVPKFNTGDIFLRLQTSSVSILL